MNFDSKNNSATFKSPFTYRQVRQRQERPPHAISVPDYQVIWNTVGEKLGWKLFILFKRSLQSSEYADIKGIYRFKNGPPQRVKLLSPKNIHLNLATGEIFDDQNRMIGYRNKIYFDRESDLDPRGETLNRAMRVNETEATVEVLVTPSDESPNQMKYEIVTEGYIRAPLRFYVVWVPGEREKIYKLGQIYYQRVRPGESRLISVSINPISEVLLDALSGDITMVGKIIGFAVQLRPEFEESRFKVVIPRYGEGTRFHLLPPVPFSSARKTLRLLPDKRCAVDLSRLDRYKDFDMSQDSIDENSWLISDED